MKSTALLTAAAAVVASLAFAALPWFKPPIPSKSLKHKHALNVARPAKLAAQNAVPHDALHATTPNPLSRWLKSPDHVLEH